MIITISSNRLLEKSKSGNTGVIKIKGYYGKPNCRLIEHIYINQTILLKIHLIRLCRAESAMGNDKII